jgi:hypothetical protein
VWALEGLKRDSNPSLFASAFVIWDLEQQQPNTSIRTGIEVMFGDEAMEFPHDRTAHDFRVSPDGGAIEVMVNDVKDLENLKAIRIHLKHVALMFSNGDFSVPMSVHSEVPPGVNVVPANSVLAGHLQAGRTDVLGLNMQ